MTLDRRLLTADDLLNLPDDGYRYELLDGELIRMAPTGGEHNDVGGNIYWALSGFVRSRGLGRVLVGDTGVILRRHPDRVRAPDVCFIARERLPDGRVPEGYLEIVPDLIVEVISPGDRPAEVAAKIAEWLAAGARLVWAVYPRTKEVIAHRGPGDRRVYRAGDILDAEPVLPDFTYPVAALFA